MGRIRAMTRGSVIPTRRAMALVTLVLALAFTGVVPVIPAEAEDASGGGAAEVDTSPWRQVTTGDSHTCGIRTSGRLYCWGYDTSGQLGDGGGNTDQSSPVEVFGGGTNWASVDGGGGHTCARKTTGRIYCWGSDDSGQVGDGGPNTNQAIPVEVLGGVTDWTSVSAGGGHTCARRVTGRLYCWGKDDGGQLGDGGANADQPSPVLVAGPATNWTSVSAGASHTCARRATGRIYCWGFDGSGQLGDGGADINRQAPVRVAGGISDWAAVSAGGTSTCARRVNGKLYCWGDDFYGQVGDGGANTARHAPVPVAGTSSRWVTVSVGGYHTCARRTTGRLYCWGDDFYGQVGDGGANSERHGPTLVAGGGTNWAGVASGYKHTCARRTTGRLFCWGSDDVGQLGNGAATGDRSIPDRIL